MCRGARCRPPQRWLSRCRSRPKGLLRRAHRTRAQPTAEEACAVERRDDARRVLGMFENDEANTGAATVRPPREPDADDGRDRLDEEPDLSLAHLVAEVPEEHVRLQVRLRALPRWPIVRAVVLSRPAAVDDERSPDERWQAR